MIDDNQLTRKLVTNFRYLEEEDVIKKLNRSIVCQCIDDILNSSNKKEAVENKEEAEKWLFQNSDDLYEVCANAEVSVNILRRSVKILIGNYGA